MTGRLPLIVVTLPGRTVADVLRQAETARAAGGDLAEVRLDLWTPEDRASLRGLFPAPLPLVATLRSRAEGGGGPDAPAERATELIAAAACPFRWLDLEADRDGALLGHLPPTTSLGRILSTHLPAGAGASALAERIREGSEAGSIRKVVTPATVGILLKEILPLLSRDAGNSCVVLTTGPSGGLLRAWSARLGFPLVYASLPSPRGPSDPDLIEPSQIPVDRLRPFFEGGTDAPIFAVVGHPVAHSLSPYLHSRWMRSHHRSGLYLSLDIATESEFVESLSPLADDGFRGLNVTHPWKNAALEAATRVGPGALRCGVANCLTFRDGEVEGENTDLAAVLRRLEEYRQSLGWDGRELAVVGAGGAAAATLAAAAELGVEAYVLARDGGHAEAIAHRFGARSLRSADARPFSLVVHATPVGRDDAGPLQAPVEHLVRPGTLLLDWVYSPADAVVRESTERAGGTYEDGWRLLVYQAAASFALWWGDEPDPDELDNTIAEGPCTA
jgi:shikimate dehydrogenase